MLSCALEKDILSAQEETCSDSKGALSSPNDGTGARKIDALPPKKGVCMYYMFC
jgi:hypothetical protein